MTLTQQLTLRCSEIRQRLNEITGHRPARRFTDEIRQRVGHAHDRVSGDRNEAPRGHRRPRTRTRLPRRRPWAIRRRGSGPSWFAGPTWARSSRLPSNTGTRPARRRSCRASLSLNPNQIPLALLRREPEIRTTVSTAPTDTGAAQQPIVPPVFPDSVAAFLGIETPTVPVGDANVPGADHAADRGRAAQDASQSVDHTNATFDGGA